MKALIVICLLLLTWHFCKGMLLAVLGAIGAILMFLVIGASWLVSAGLHALFG